MWLHNATVRNVNRALKEVNAFEWEGDYRPFARAALKEIMEHHLTNEIDEFLMRGWYERRDPGERVVYRNGGYLRHLLTELGDVVIRIPALRRGFRFRALGAYKRRPRHIDRLIMASFVLGMSTRKVAATLVPLLGERISPQLVSNIARALDTQVARFHARPLKDRYRLLFFDGVVLTHKGAARVQKRFILTAVGITWEGKKELIDYMLCPSESQACWEGFLNDLYRRGLTGEGCELIISDGGAGLTGALDLVYLRLDRQLCWAHKTRNVLEKVKKAGQAQVKKALQAISHAPHRKAASQAFWSFCQRYRERYPRAVKSLERHIESLLTFYQVDLSREEKQGLSPEEMEYARLSLWRKIRTTNIIERTFREVKRRTRPMGVFMNKQSMERMLFAVFHYFNHKEEDGSLFLFTERF